MLLKHWYHPMDFGSPNFEVFDWDNDGDMDILRDCSDWITGSPISCIDENRAVFVPEVDQKYDSYRISALYGPQANHGFTNLADFDGDGDDDLIWSTKTQVKYYEREADGFNIDVYFDMNPLWNDTGIELTTIRSGDFDNDGDLDLVCVIDDNLHVSWNNGNGNGGSAFSEFEASLVYCRGMGTLIVLDLDNDGDDDISYGCYYGKEVAWVNNKFIETGQRGFDTEVFKLYHERTTRDLYGGVDIDNDGCMDLYISRDIFRNNYCETGVKSFSKITPTMHPDFNLRQNYDNFAAVGDFNNDGHLDYLSTGRSVMYWQGDGANTWPADKITIISALVNTAENPQLFFSFDLRVYAVDPDADGDDDLLVVFRATGAIALMTNDGSPGGLTKDTPFRMIYEPPVSSMWDLVEMYYDNDGAKDLVMTSSKLGVSVLRNLVSIDCVGSYSSFGACTGDGSTCTHTQTYMYLPPAANGGTECATAAGTTITESCPCPVDCVGAYVASACEGAVCSQTKTFTYAISQPSLHGGVACSNDAGDTYVEPCPCAPLFGTGDVEDLTTYTPALWGMRTLHDFNGDGTLDLIHFDSLDQWAPIGMRLNAPGGGLLYPNRPTISLSNRDTSHNQVSDVVPLDIDDDGDLDLVISNT